jgi:hypothetical protein
MVHEQQLLTLGSRTSTRGSKRRNAGNGTEAATAVPEDLRSPASAVSIPWAVIRTENRWAGAGWFSYLVPNPAAARQGGKEGTGGLPRGGAHVAEARRRLVTCPLRRDEIRAGSIGPGLPRIVKFPVELDQPHAKPGQNNSGYSPLFFKTWIIALL